MNTRDLTLVRVYLAERSGKLEELGERLRDAGIGGWTVFRGVEGFGSSGKMRTASLVDLALDLPVTVEFFDTPERIEQLLPEVVALAGSDHVVWWRVTGSANSNAD